MNSEGQSPVGLETNLQQGILAGSILLTLAGEVAVEDIAVGARVITRDSGMAIVRRVCVRTLRSDVVRILAGSLGHRRPERDVRVLADQRILVRDWRAEAMFARPQALVAARALIDGEFVTLEASKAVTVFEIECERPHVLYADGLEIASYSAGLGLAKAA